MTYFLFDTRMLLKIRVELGVVLQIFGVVDQRRRTAQFVGDFAMC